jgi:hypothetical protein
MVATLSKVITWRGYLIKLSCKMHYPLDTMCHIEVRCDQAIPITETGYRSHFMPLLNLEDYGCYVAYVEAWLEEAAQSKSWKVLDEAKRQGNLFDFD